MWSLVILWLALITLGACSGGSSEEPSAADDSFTVPSGAKSVAPPAGGAITGVLTFDDIEGGCSFVATADGKRYEVLYPAGWTLDRAAGVLRGPDGTVVRAGATITVEGAVATGRSSICQVGPIFQASTVRVEPG